MKELVFRMGFEITGIGVNCTSKNDSVDSERLLSSAWKLFFDCYYAKLKPGSSVYAVYSYHEPTNPSNFSICIGSDNSMHTEQYGHRLTTTSIKSGRYLFFTAAGTYPDVVSSLWSEVEDYFNQINCPYQRGFTTDYAEVLPNGQLIIAVSVKEAVSINNRYKLVNSS